MHSQNAGYDSATTAGPEDESLARRLVAARLSAEIQAEYPGQLPATLEQAYGVQAMAISAWPDELAGWKVARLPADDQVRLAQERLAGPVFRSTVQAIGAEGETVADIYEGGFAAIEAEIILELGADFPAGSASDEIDLASLVARAFCGAEIASSPMPFVIELGATSIISDMGTNAGVIVGPEIEDFLSLSEDALTASVSVNGEIVGEANPGAVTGTPFDALRFLVDHCTKYGISLAAGTLVSTGMITGVHDVRVGDMARVDFGPPGWFDVSFKPVGRR